MPHARPVELLQEAVHLLRQLTDQGRAWSADDLLTAEEARRRLKAGKDNREARAASLTRTRPARASGRSLTGCGRVVGDGDFRDPLIYYCAVIDSMTARL